MVTCNSWLSDILPHPVGAVQKPSQEYPKVGFSVCCHLNLHGRRYDAVASGWELVEREGLFPWQYGAKSLPHHYGFDSLDIRQSMTMTSSNLERLYSRSTGLRSE